VANYRGRSGGRLLGLGVAASLAAGVLAAGCSADGTASVVPVKAKTAVSALIVGDDFSGDNDYAKVTPINVATQVTGKPYTLGATLGGSLSFSGQAMAVARTSHGLTAYVIVNGGVVPVNLTSHMVGPAIWLGTNQMTTIAASPDGKTLYAGSLQMVKPVGTATSTPGATIPYGAKTFS
jgi:hypothetical protein